MLLVQTQTYQTKTKMALVRFLIFPLMKQEYWNKETILKAMTTAGLCSRHLLLWEEMSIQKWALWGSHS